MTDRKDFHMDVLFDRDGTGSFKSRIVENFCNKEVTLFNLFDNGYTKGCVLMLSTDTQRYGLRLSVASIPIEWYGIPADLNIFPF